MLRIWYVRLVGNVVVSVRIVINIAFAVLVLESKKYAHMGVFVMRKLCRLDRDVSFGVWDIFCILLQHGLILLFCILFVKYRLEPDLRSLSKVTAMQVDPVVLDGFTCQIDENDYTLPLYGEDLLELGFVDSTTFSSWDQHQDYVLNVVYKDYYIISGTVSYVNGRWYTKRLSVDLKSVQADSSVFGFQRIFLNDRLQGFDYDFLFTDGYSGVYRIYAANAVTGFDRSDSIRIYADQYTDVVTKLEYMYYQEINKPAHT